MRPARISRLAAALIVVALAGCSNSTDSMAPPANQPPPATTPTGAVKRFEWAFVNRDIDAMSGLFADDFVLIVSDVDTAGSPSRIAKDRAWTLAALGAMFDGVPDQRPPAEQITFILDKTLLPFNDSRLGKDPRWHKQIRTSVNLNVRTDTGELFEVTSNALFFLTRGDSASIPAELVARGFKPDSTVWWIDRWGDETLAGSGAPSATSPVRTITLYDLLNLFYPDVTP